MAQLKRKSVRGGSITAVAQAANVAIHFLSTVTLARILHPEEFGVISMVLAVTLFARLFRDLGLSSSTIQRQALTKEQLSTLYWINVLAGATLTAIVAASAPLVAWFYGRPELTWVTVALSFSFLIGSFSTQQGALLIREMRFGRSAIATLSGALATFVISAVLALQGWSYWALVVGTLSGGILTTVLLNSLSGWRPGRPRRGTGVRSMLRYGLNLTAFDFVNYFARNLDNILIGKFAGADALGLYSRAYNLLMFPITNLRGPINSVAFPALSRLQKHPVEFRQYYRLVIGVLAVTSMPLVGFFYVAAEPMIRVALGERWLPVAGLFSILAFAAFFQTPASFRGTVLMSLGLGRRHLEQGVMNAIVTCAGFLVGIRWGATGVAVSYALSSTLLVYAMHHFSFRGTPLQVRDFFGPILSPVLGTLLAVLVTLGVRTQGWVPSLPIFDLAVSFGIFALVYLGALSLQADSRALLRQAWRLVKDARQRRSAAPAAVRAAPVTEAIVTASQPAPASTGRPVTADQT